VRYLPAGPAEGEVNGSVTRIFRVSQVLFERLLDCVVLDQVRVVIYMIIYQ
jgi:hypothetical protein